MTRFHGIEADTYDKLILDSGAIYIGESILGATRGGATFKRTPKYIELPYEGIAGKVVGQKHLIGVEVTLEVNIISFDKDNLGYSIPNSLVSAPDPTFVTITESAWDSVGVHTISEISILAEISGESQPIIITLYNPIAERDLSFNFKDKSEVVSKWIFSAYYKESTGFDTPPWKIRWPA